MLYRNLELHNVEQVWPAEKGKGLRLSRLPEAVRQAVNPGAASAALHAAGCEMRLNLKPGDEARLVLQVDKTKFAWERGGLVEVFQGEFQSCWYYVGTRPAEIVVKAPENLERLKEIQRRSRRPARFDPALTRIVLPYRPALRLLSLEGKWSPPAPRQTPRKRLLIYGTSLTHGAWSVRPTETYAMLLARSLGMDLINLGFGGACHYEPAVAEYIASRRDWDVAVFESHNMTAIIEPEDFRARLRGVLETVCRARPRKPVFCVNLFMLSEVLPEVAANSAKHRALRQAARAAVKDVGRPNVKWIPTERLFRDPVGLTTDLVHPSPWGMYEIASAMGIQMTTGL